MPKLHRHIMMVTLFTKFLELPAKLQIQIWKYAMSAIGPRVVSVLVRSPGVRELEQSCPAVLHACHDSRKYSLEGYGSVFASREKPWAWEGSQKSKRLRTVTRSLGIRNIRGSIAAMIDAITKYLNNPQITDVRWSMHSKLLDAGPSCTML